jgi:hypothetical protein
MQDNSNDMARKGRSGPSNHPDKMARGDAHYLRIHPELSYGILNPAHKLTELQVVEIRRRYAAGGVYQTELAREFGVDPHSISCIVRFKNWKHLPG